MNEHVATPTLDGAVNVNVRAIRLPCGNVSVSGTGVPAPHAIDSVTPLSVGAALGVTVMF